MENTAPDLSGRTLSDRYELIRRVGEGAMGSVYLARHTFMHREVAVKVLHPQLLTNAEVVERFQREAQASAHINHPNVCAATDFGRFDDAFFLVMEWLDGRALDDILAEEDMGIDKALHIAIQIADALDRAHELGIVHRDLKPANIMIVSREEDPCFVKVTDFGVARVRLSVDSTKLTQAGMTYGTPSYMAPEQAAGEEIDQRADIYALGVVLFELVTGRVPFTGGSVAQVLAAHVTEAPPRPSSVAHQEIPTALENLILSCLAKSPDGRPQTAKEMQAALIKCREPSSTTKNELELAQTVAPSGVAVPAKNLFKDRKLIPIGGALLALFIFVALGIGLFTGRVVNEQVDSFRQSTLAEERARFAQQPDIAAALELQAKGELEAALEGLLNARLSHKDNAHFNFLLASAQFQTGNLAEAVEGFNRAAELEPLYRADSGVRAAILEAFSHNEKTSKAAGAYLKAHWDDDYSTKIVALSENSERRVRERVEKALKDSEVWENLERWQQLSFELRNTRRCKDLSALLDEAAKLNRKKLASSFQFVDALPKRGCGFLKRDDCYSCIREQVKTIVADL